jgi:hypothetical protein
MKTYMTAIQTITNAEMEILRLHEDLKGQPSSKDFSLPTFISHVDAYKNNPVKLKHYAGQVINARLLIQIGLSLTKTFCFLDQYQYGTTNANPYAMISAARSQIELAAIVWDLTAIIRSNAGPHREQFYQRVRTVDLALINATYGTRSDTMKEVFRTEAGSKLRSVEQSDVITIEAKNVLTRIDRLSNSSPYGDARKHYDNLCEILHPNMSQNTIIMAAHPARESVIRMSRFGKAIEWARRAAAIPLCESAHLTVEAVQKWKAPFFEGEITHDFSKINKTINARRNEKCPCGSGKKFKYCCGGSSN